MKIGIVGAGAIGGVLGVSLAQMPDVEVSVLARGATLDALKTRGWRLTFGGETRTGAVRAGSIIGPKGGTEAAMLTGLTALLNAYATYTHHAAPTRSVFSGC